MPTRNISLTKEQDALVEKMIKSGAELEAYLEKLGTSPRKTVA
jgi:hypothetical protein